MLGGWLLLHLACRGQRGRYLTVYKMKLAKPVVVKTDDKNEPEEINNFK